MGLGGGLGRPSEPVHRSWCVSTAVDPPLARLHLNSGTHPSCRIFLTEPMGGALAVFCAAKTKAVIFFSPALRARKDNRNTEPQAAGTAEPTPMNVQCIPQNIFLTLERLFCNEGAVDCPQRAHIVSTTQWDRKSAWRTEPHLLWHDAGGEAGRLPYRQWVLNCGT